MPQIAWIHKTALALALSSLSFFVICGCRNGAGFTDGKPQTTALSSKPPVGRVDDSAGFFVEVLSTPNVEPGNFDIHKGSSTFDEPCKGELGKIVDCILDANEGFLYTHPVSLHYHFPKSMCDYVSIEPFYFLNRQTKLTTRLTKHIDASGDIGLDTNNDGDIDSQDFGCYSELGVPVCCVGEYPETTFTWDAIENKYGSPSTNVVRRTLGSCISGPGAQTKAKTSLGLPLRSYKDVKGEGISDAFQLDSVADHGVGPAWLANYFDPAQHGNKAPQAFKQDIDTGAGELMVGNPYYLFNCHDSALETLASIRVQIREWNTSAAYEARHSAPDKYDDSGVEVDPWGAEDKNDWPDWLDFEIAQIRYPGFEYR